jgi:mono/diheme cytochrome c family protein
MRNLWTFAVLTVVGSLAFATMGYHSAFVAHYPETKGTQLDSCATCHMPNLADFLNGYGLDVRENPTDFSAIEDQDSDGDGKSNLEEITELAFPGSQAPYLEYFIFNNPKAEVHFNHELHSLEPAYGSSGNCANCHAEGLFPKVFDDTVSIRKQAHSTCLRCHMRSGSESAPIKCGECHMARKIPR